MNETKDLGGRRETIRAIVPALLTTLVAASVAAVTIDGGFVLDDSTAILANPVVRGEVPWYEAFVRSFWGAPITASGVDTYRPLGTLHLRLLYVVFGAAPLGYRCTTVLLHVTAVAIARRSMLDWGKPVWVANATALLFATHAVHAQALGMIVGQVDVLATLLGLLALHRATSASASASRSRQITSALLLLVACLVKESAFVYGFAIVAAFALPGRPADERKRAIAPALVVALVVAAQLALPRMTRVWSNGLVFESHGLERLMVGLAWLAKGSFLCFVPMDLVPTHGYAELDPSFGTLAPYAAAGAAFLLVSAVFFLGAFRRGDRTLTILAALLVAPLLLVSGLVVRTPTDLPERLLYGPSFAVSALVAIGLARGMPEPRRRTFAIGALALAMFLGGAIAQRPWVSTLSLADYAVETSPRVMHHHAYRAVESMKAGRYDVASYELGLAAWIFNRYPHPVDWTEVERYEATHAPNDWLELPEVLFAGDTCRAVVGILRGAHGEAPALEPYMLRGYAARYPACFR